MTTAIRTFRVRTGFCARCAAPLFYGTWRACDGCGAPVCRARRRCINKRTRHQCPTFQTLETSCPS
ncbi:hypothetical protein [Streptomyces sp. WAC01280]|uniref:hypothetical protein n=1 Tax=Streptomyces sp. WAC01280 TaxID=2487424 RepID=UPI000F7AA7DA|nr:hypothetical protein [Streptomyces sp. WAC01280]RSS50062.1 hypothetical protein EF909_39315 [Streptomyces sp. WAC01280]